MGKKKEGPQIICKMTQSAWRPHTQVPTYYVAARSRKGFFTTINDAINFAEPYSRIEVTSGKYFENVIIHKPLEIGTNPNEDTMAEIYSRGVTFTFQTSEAHVEGLRIRTADSKSNGVMIEMGNPRIIRCDVDSISVSGSATPTVEDNKIHNSKLHGLSVLDNAGGLYRANTIENHPGFSVVVESDGEPKFTHNKVTFGELGQVQIKGNPASQRPVNPIFMFNAFRDELPDKEASGKVQYSGAGALAKLKDLPLKKTGDPVNLLPHVIPRGRLADLDSDDAAVADESTLQETRAAVQISSGAAPKLVQNTISGGIANGIIIIAGGRGEILENKIVSNRGFGIAVEGKQTRPVIRKNIISENGAGGLRARNGGGAEVRFNSFVDNRGPGIVVQHNCDRLEVMKNDIFSGPKPGVLCRDEGNGKFEDNFFRDCYIGVRVESQANPMFFKNLFQACHIGAACVRYGRGHFDENEFANCRQTCVAVTTNANPTFFHCRMVASEHAVLVQHRGRGRFDGNQIKDNSSAQVVVRLFSNPTFVNNHIADGREEGVRISDHARGTFRFNSILANGIANVEVCAGADPIFESNIIQNASGNGLVVMEEAYGTFIENIVEGNHGDGIRVQEGGFPTVRANYLHSNEGAGLHIAEHGDGCFEKNEIAGNRATNVLITGAATSATAAALPKARGATTTAGQDGAGGAAGTQSGAAANVLDTTVGEHMPVVRRNWITHAQQVGVTASSRGRCLIIENHIAHSHIAAVKVAAGSLLVVVHNVFEGGEGVTVADEGQCVLVDNRFDRVTGSAITLLTGARPIMAWNTIVGCRVGISCEGGAGYLFENAVISCGVGIAAKQFNRSLLQSNVVLDCKTGCAISARAKTTVRGNMFRDNDTAVSCDGDGISAVVEANAMISQREAGISLRSGAATFSTNLILDNPINVLVGGYLAVAGLPKIVDSIISGNIGIAGSSRGRARIENCLVERCKMAVTTASHAAVMLTKCTVVRSEVGCMLWREGGGDFEDCLFKGNVRNVTASMRSTPQFLRCAFVDAKFFNVSFSGGAHGSVTECVIARSKVGGGVHLEGDANPRFERCFITGHKGAADIVRRNANTGHAHFKVHSQRKVSRVRRRHSSFGSHSKRKSTIHIVDENNDAADATPTAVALSTPPGGRSPPNDTSKLPSIAPTPPSEPLSSAQGRSSRRGSKVLARVDSSVSSQRGSGGQSTTPKPADKPADQQVLADVPDVEHLPDNISSSDSSSGDDDRDIRDEYGLLLSDEAKKKLREERRERRKARRSQLDTKDQGVFRGHAVVSENGGGGTFFACRFAGNDIGFKLRSGATTAVEGCRIEANETYGLLFEEGANGKLERCIVSRNKLSQLVATGTGTSPTLEGNNICEGISNGVQVDLQATPHVVANVMYNLLGAAVVALEGGAPVVEENLMFNCNEGIMVRAGGGGDYVQNRITRMKANGITVEGGAADAHFSQCEVCECARLGMLVTDDAAPNVVQCMFHRNGQWGVEVSERATPTLSSCYVFHNVDGGVLFTEEAGGRMESSTVFTNLGIGVSVRLKSKPTIEGNVFFGGDDDAVVVSNASPALLRNRVRYHGGSGLRIDGPMSEPVVRMNNVDACDHSGIRYSAGAKGNCEFNVCCANRLAGLHVEDEAGPAVRDCFFKQNYVAGILCSTGAAPRVEGAVCALSERGCGVIVESLARPNLTRVTVAHNGHFGLQYREGGKGAATECLAVNNNEANVCIETRSTPSLNECLILDGGGIGVVVRDGGFGLLSGCHVTGQLQIGIVVEVGCAPQFETLVVRDMKSIGVADSGKSTYEACYFYNCPTAVETREGGSKFTGCDIRDGGIGVRATGGHAEFIECNFAIQQRHGVLIEHDAELTVTQSKFFHCKDAFVSHGGGLVSQSEFSHNHEGITVIAGDLRAEGNTVFDSATIGILIRGGSPMILANYAFDNYYASCQIDGGSPTVEDNRFFFQRDGGALVNNKADTARVQKNLERNTQAGPWEKSAVDRTREYSSQVKADAEKGTPRYRKATRSLETAYQAAIIAARDALRGVEIVVPPGLVQKLLLHEPFDFEELEQQSAASNSLVLAALTDAESIAKSSGVELNRVDLPDELGTATTAEDAEDMSAAMGESVLAYSMSRRAGAPPTAGTASFGPGAQPSAAAADGSTTPSAQAPQSLMGSAHALDGTHASPSVAYVPVRDIPLIPASFAADGEVSVLGSAPTDEPNTATLPSGRVTFTDHRRDSSARRGSSAHGAFESTVGPRSSSFGPGATSTIGVDVGDMLPLDDIVRRLTGLIVQAQPTGGARTASTSGGGPSSPQGTQGMASSTAKHRSASVFGGSSREEGSLGGSSKSRRGTVAPTKPSEGKAADASRRRLTKK